MPKCDKGTLCKNCGTDGFTDNFKNFYSDVSK